MWLGEGPPAAAEMVTVARWLKWGLLSSVELGEREGEKENGEEGAARLRVIPAYKAVEVDVQVVMHHCACTVVARRPKVALFRSAARPRVDIEGADAVKPG